MVTACIFRPLCMMYAKATSAVHPRYFTILSCHIFYEIYKIQCGENKIKVNLVGRGLFCGQLPRVGTLSCFLDTKCLYYLWLPKIILEMDGTHKFNRMKNRKKVIERLLVKKQNDCFRHRNT